MAEPRVGFIGLGNMGGRMARCLTDKGWPVVGYDTRNESLTAPDVRRVQSIREVVDDSDIILLSLPDSKVVESVIYSEDGVLSAFRKGQIVVDLSTSAPESTKKIADELSQRDGAFLDIGVSGGAVAADKGALTLMVGGSADVLQKSRPILSAFATHIFHCGATGAGHTVKLLNNFLNAISLSATAEVMVAARKAGLDLETVLDVFNASTGINYATLNRFPKIIHGDYLKGGLTNTLMLKDVSLYLDCAASLGVASLHGSGPTAAFGLARQLGYADEISNTVVDAIGDISGRVRLYESDEGVSE